MPDEHDFIELVMLDRAHHIGDMRLEVDLGSGEMRALAKPGERRNFDPMALGAQPLGDALPDPAALPCAMHQDEARRLAHGVVIFISFSALRRTIASRVFASNSRAALASVWSLPGPKGASEPHPLCSVPQ